MKQTKIVLFSKYGNFDELFIDQVDVPTSTSEQICIKKAHQMMEKEKLIFFTLNCLSTIK